MQEPEREDKSLVNRVHAFYAQLPSGERKVADVVLDFPGEIAAYSASELAELAQVSNATVTRFVRRLGYVGYDDARRSARRQRELGSPLFMASKATESEQIGSELLARFAAEETSLIEATFESIDPVVLAGAVDALATARRVFFLGFRNSAYLAGYGRGQFMQFRGDVYMLAGTGESLAERIADLRPKDVLVAVGMRRRIAHFDRYVESASRGGARVLLVTDPSARGIPAFAHWTFRCAVENPHVLDSYAGAIALLRLLAVETMNKLGRTARGRLQDIETLHASLGELD